MMRELLADGSSCGGMEDGIGGDGCDEGAEGEIGDRVVAVETDEGGFALKIDVGVV